MRYPRAGCQGYPEITHSSRDVNPLLMGGKHAAGYQIAGKGFSALSVVSWVGMRRGSGGSRAVWCGAAFCAAAACGGVLQSPPVQSAQAAACELIEMPSTTADTATIAFHARGMSRESCALALVAEALRPWPTPSSTHRWTVHVSLTATGATAAAVRQRGGA